MRKIACFGLVILLTWAVAGCHEPGGNAEQSNEKLNELFGRYYDERMGYFPLEATANGDDRYNDYLPADFTDGYRDTLRQFFKKYLNEVSAYDREKMNRNDRISYDIFKREMEMSVEGLDFHENYLPFSQFTGLPLTMGQMGSGSGNQPFKTAKDYRSWLQRMKSFNYWADSAIAYFRKGMATGYVWPQSIVVKMIPQMKAMVSDSIKKSLFYTPVTQLPDSISAGDKESITAAFADYISNYINPAYQKLAKFLEEEYLPAARKTSGLSAYTDGDKMYKYYVRYWTTTSQSPEQIYQTGLAEVARIGKTMDSIKEATGFKGDRKAFFEFLKNDPRFMPYKTPDEVLNAFRSIQERIAPHLKTMFGVKPRSPFEIRQTEAFRAASASAEYNPPSEDGSRPGIFYVPILDARKFNTTSGMESLFLHEAIPGHHYQISLQQENKDLPKFRRFCWYGAYGEGWALYCESLGKELGLYTDPYQYMGALGDEMHRAIRLVVDVALHSKQMTREQAIAYMMENEAISEQGATAEIERYMVLPAQALSYKIGALKIRELRNKYSKEQGASFSLAAFHDALLKDGCMPLDVLEQKGMK